MNKVQQKLLLLQIRNRCDAESFTKLYEWLVNPLYRYIYFKVSDPELARDLTSEVFLKAWKRLTKLVERKEELEVKQLRAYFYTVARNLVIDHYRYQANFQEDSLESAVGLPSSSQPLEEIELTLEVKQIMALIKNLKDSYQEVLLLRYVEDLGISEIARVMQKTPLSTRVLLHRAGMALKREYERQA